MLCAVLSPGITSGGQFVHVVTLSVLFATTASAKLPSLREPFPCRSSVVGGNTVKTLHFPVAAYAGIQHLHEPVTQPAGCHELTWLLVLLPHCILTDFCSVHSDFTASTIPRDRLNVITSHPCPNHA